ncbi:CYFA0S12e04236g1_1 [Cyberlindnera fabianii]|uniref:CYFA0S12e04236g1_1 n=1 Tax=Cyberlindnera fabianii TaxID=36022 RepID=A0A061B7D0_CYBFA|nr:hypothetical protein BON22_4714 [Cyberlindnera fabianii]CDR43778.1 CYFA0S12e04236g1_1 [Cyberlindnera fabianii]
MGGRIHGFLGGVLLTSCIAYYTSQEFKRNQEFVSKTIRETEAIIDNHGKPKVDVPRAIEFQHRPSIKQTIADIWDDQILKVVHWTYSLNIEKGTADIVEYLESAINKAK